MHLSVDVLIFFVHASTPIGIMQSGVLLQQESSNEGDSPPPSHKGTGMQGPPVSVEGDSSSGGVPVDDQDSRDTKRNQGGGGQGQQRGTENSSSVSADETTLREGSSSNATAAAASDAKRTQAEHEGGAACEGDPVSIETIQNLLLMVPVDLEKLRNLAWEKGGYQVRVV